MFVACSTLCFAREPLEKALRLIAELEFDKLSRMVQKQTNTSERVPGIYLKAILSLESSINNAVAKEKEAENKLKEKESRLRTREMPSPPIPTTPSSSASTRK